LYVKTNKGKAHPSSFKLLNSVYASFERAATPGKISPSEKKKLLYVELNKYKELKEKIDSNRGPEPEPMHAYGTSAKAFDGAAANDQTAPKAPSAADQSDGEKAVTQQYIDTVVANLKTAILQELAAIREEVARLGKSN
jgi:hypothetical protein